MALHPEAIGPYRIVAERGRGGMGVVYEALDERLGRRVALKLLTQARQAEPAARRRFRREGEALAKVRHPHVVAVHDAGEHAGLPYLVLDWVEGASLEEHLRRREQLPPAEVVRLGRQLAAGLAAAHAQRILHRDLKPDNVLLDEAGNARLTDFGLAKDLDRAGVTQRLSQSGAFMGSPGYWSPEQTLGDPSAVGPASDVYGLGATLYALLSGGPPVDESTFMGLVVATREKPPAPLPGGVPVGLRAVIERCLAKDPGARFPSAEALEAALAELEDGEAEDRLARPLLAAAGLALLAALGALGWAARGPSETPSAPASTPALASSSVPAASAPTAEATERGDSRSGAALRRFYELARAGEIVPAGLELERVWELGDQEQRRAVEVGRWSFGLEAFQGPQLELRFLYVGDRRWLLLLTPEAALVWDLEVANGAKRWGFQLERGSRVACAASAPYFVASMEGELRRQDLRDTQARVSLRRPPGPCSALALSPDGQLAVTVEGAALLGYDFANQGAPVMRPLPLGSQPQLAFTPDGWLLLATRDPHALLAFPPGFWRDSALQPRRLGSPGGPPLGLLRAGERFLVPTGVGQASLLDLERGVRSYALVGEEGEREAPPLALAAGATPPLALRLLRQRGKESPLAIYALEERARELSRRMVLSQSDAIAISPDERLLAVGESVEGKVNVYCTGGPGALRASGE